jgi:hypothetical protein
VLDRIEQGRHGLRFVDENTSATLLGVQGVAEIDKKPGIRGKARPLPGIRKIDSRGIRRQDALDKGRFAGLPGAEKYMDEGLPDLTFQTRPEIAEFCLHIRIL